MTPSLSTPESIPASPGTNLPVGNVNTVNFPPETPETPETPAVAAPVTDTIPAQVPSVPVSQDPWQVNKLESGEYEVRLPTGQIYKGNEQQVINELAKAQFHASNTISNLKTQVPQAPAPAIPTEQFDPAAEAIADLLAPYLGMRNGRELKEALGSQQQTTEQYRANMENATFLQRNPDFPQNPMNAQKMEETVQALGLPWNAQSLEVAHYYLKGRGQYVAAAPQQPMGQTASPVPSPLPPPPGSNQPQQGVPTEKDLWALSDSELIKLARGY